MEAIAEAGVKQLNYLKGYSNIDHICMTTAHQGSADPILSMQYAIIHDIEPMMYELIAVICASPQRRKVMAQIAEALYSHGYELTKPPY